MTDKDADIDDNIPKVIEVSFSDIPIEVEDDDDLSLGNYSVTDQLHDLYSKKHGSHHPSSIFHQSMDPFSSGNFLMNTRKSLPFELENTTNNIRDNKASHKHKGAIIKGLYMLKFEEAHDHQYSISSDESWSTQYISIGSDSKTCMMKIYESQQKHDNAKEDNSSKHVKEIDLMDYQVLDRKVKLNSFRYKSQNHSGRCIFLQPKKQNEAPLKIASQDKDAIKNLFKTISRVQLCAIAHSMDFADDLLLHYLSPPSKQDELLSQINGNEDSQNGMKISNFKDQIVNMKKKSIFAPMA